jgi:hypothetical protein
MSDGRLELDYDYDAALVADESRYETREVKPA